MAFDQIAGAEKAPAAVSALIDFRNWRRFIEPSRGSESRVVNSPASGVPQDPALVVAV